MIPENIEEPNEDIDINNIFEEIRQFMLSEKIVLYQEFVGNHSIRYKVNLKIQNTIKAFKMQFKILTSHLF